MANMQQPPADTVEIKDITKDDPPDSKQNKSEENAKTNSIEDLELPVRLKGIEAPPLTTEQLKIIPKLMEVVHVGHNADVKTEQKWKDNCPRALLQKGDTTEKPSGKCMFGMVLTDSPRNHNWTAFHELDDCMKNNKPFNFKPNRKEMFNDAAFNQSLEDASSGVAKCPFMRARDQGSGTDCPPQLALGKSSSPEKEKCPFSSKGEIAKSAKKQTDVDIKKDQWELAPSDSDFEKKSVPEIQSANKVKLAEVKEALSNYKKQLEEFQSLQQQVLSLKDVSTDEKPLYLLGRPPQEVRAAHVESSSPKPDQVTCTEYACPMRKLINIEFIRGFMAFCLMFIVAHVVGELFR